MHQSDCQPRLLKQFGALRDGFSQENIVGRYWPLIVLTRWALTITIMIFLRDYYAQQIQCLLLISLLNWITILFTSPLKTRADNFMQGLNELMISAYLYQLIMLSDLNPGQAAKNIIAWVLLSTVIASILSGILKACYDVYQIRRNRIALKRPTA